MFWNAFYANPKLIGYHGGVVRDLITAHNIRSTSISMSCIENKQERDSA